MVASRVGDPSAARISIDGGSSFQLSHDRRSLIVVLDGAKNEQSILGKPTS